MKLNLSDQYDHKALVRYGLMMVAATLLFKVTGGAAALALPFVVIAALVQRKPITLMFWVLFMTMTGIGNRTIFAMTGLSLLSVRATLVLLTFVLSSRVFGSRSSRAMSIFWGIMPYMIWEAMVSLQGYEPIVSYLKLLLFFCIFLAMYGVANEVNASMRLNAKILRSVVLCAVAVMLIGSVVTIPLGIGMMAPDKATADAMLRGEITSLFCGMCAHSQAMGPMTGVLGTFVFADLLFSIKKWDSFYLLLLLACPVLCLKTSSRTGMGTFVAGVALVTFFFIQSRGVGAKWKHRVTSAVTLIAVVGSVAVVALPSVRDRATQFILKWNTGEKGRRNELTFENITMSRQGLIAGSLAGFRRKPITGNGFQVSAEMAMEHRKGLLAYLAAPIEKGVWIYAILEEGGIIGFILFTGWLLVLFPVLYKRHAYVMAATFFAFMMANLGEFSIFSMTYVGGFYWTLTFAGGTLDVQRMKNQNLPVFFVPIEQVREEVGYDAWQRELG